MTFFLKNGAVRGRVRVERKNVSRCRGRREPRGESGGDKERYTIARSILCWLHIVGMLNGLETYTDTLQSTPNYSPYRGQRHKLEVKCTPLTRVSSSV